VFDVRIPKPMRATPPHLASVFNVYRQPWLAAALYARVRRDLLGTVTAIVRERGDLVELRLGRLRILLVSAPATIHNVLVTQNRAFHKAKGPIFVGDVLGDGLLTSEGIPWRRARRMIQPAFERTTVARLGDTMVALTNEHVATWIDGEQRDMSSDMTTLALTIATVTLFGFQDPQVTRDVQDGISRAMRYANRRMLALVPLPTWIPTPGGRDFSRARHLLVGAITRIIDERRRNPGHAADLLSLLLDAVDAEGQPFTAQELRDHSLTLLLAGHETTANALAWTWHLLAQHPEVQARVEAELAQELGTQPPTAQSLAHLTYLNAVVRESLRLYPPVWSVARQAIQPFQLRGHSYPAGALVVALPWVVHRDPALYVDPDAFRPDRWLDGSASGLPEFAYFPFGGGPRLCIGKPFALTEIPLVVAAVCQQFRLHRVPGPAIRPDPLVTLRPRHGVPVTVERRAVGAPASVAVPEASPVAVG
jgi:cytochrome P450